MSLVSLRRVLGPRIALGGALLAGACQHDSNVTFDDTKLPSPPAGSSGDGQGGSGAAAGEGGGGRATGGKATAGSGAGGKPSAGGTGGKAGSGGAGGKAGAGGTGGKAGGGAAGKAGAETGGSAGKGGTGNGGGGMAGTGGMSMDPEPITFETRDIDDADVQSCFPSMNFGEDDPLNPDGNNFCTIETLIDIPLAEIPDGAQVSDASLTLTCADPGGAIVVSYVDETWSELKVRWNNRPQDGATIGNIRCDEVGDVTIDLTTAVQAWLAGEREDFGIYLRTESSDGTEFDSSEANDDAARPKLSVTYTLPVR